MYLAMKMQKMLIKMLKDLRMDRIKERKINVKLNYLKLLNNQN